LRHGGNATQAGLELAADSLKPPLAYFFNLFFKLLVMKKTFLSVMAAFLGALAYAQGETKKVDVNIDTDGGGGGWYTSPWLWIVGAAVFILLLVALTRGGGRRAD
jgi:hypothetical protein